LHFLETSKQKLEKVVAPLSSMACLALPAECGASQLYHCFSQVQDALAEFERYTLGSWTTTSTTAEKWRREAGQLRRQLLQEIRST